MKKALVLGAAGFLGSHMEHRLKQEGYYVVSVARKPLTYRRSVADEFNILDLANPPEFHAHYFRHEFARVYQFAAETGGIGHIGNPDHDVAILTNSLKINLHTLEAIRKTQSVGKIFFASSQCVYPDRFDIDPFAAERITDWTEGFTPLGSRHSFSHRESDASFNTFAFGKEKLYAEALYEAYARNYNIAVRIGRLGNTYGPYSTWQGDRAKAPAAVCRKVAQAPYAGTVDLWGNGGVRRSFTYVDDAIDGIQRLMDSNYTQPLNIASAETVTIMDLFETILRVSNKVLAHRWVDGPVGVNARGSDNTLCKQVLNWEPQTSLSKGLAITYPWVRDQALTKVNA
jgi:GDP-D-mannose 3',5'-epimerase